MDKAPNDPQPKHSTVRTALVLLLSLLTAIAAGILLRAATHSTPLAVLTGGTAFAGARAFVDRLISQSDSLQATLTSTTGSAACSTTQG